MCFLTRDTLPIEKGNLGASKCGAGRKLALIIEVLVEQRRHFGRCDAICSASMGGPGLLLLFAYAPPWSVFRHAPIPCYPPRPLLIGILLSVCTAPTGWVRGPMVQSSTKLPLLVWRALESLERDSYAARGAIYCWEHKALLRALDSFPSSSAP